MSTLPDDLDLLAAEYVLGTLEGADLDRARALEQSADDFRARVAHWRGHFLALDDTAAIIPPRAEMWDAIATRLDATPQDKPVAAAQRSDARAPQSTAPIAPDILKKIRATLSFWRTLAVASAFASVLFGIALISLIARGPESPVHVAVLNTGDGRAAAVVNAYANGTVELIPLEQIQVPEGRIIEVWTLQNREQGPVSIGKLNQARRLKLDLRNLQRPDANHLFELTLEPPGGSPTGKPTGPILMKGLAARGV
ncbi:MAG: anti-sigma factor [Beijerinckiaceae bacterium]